MEKLQGPFREKQEKLYKVIYSKNGHGTMTVMSAIPTAYVTPPSFHWGINSSGEVFGCHASQSFTAFFNSSPLI